MCLGHLPAGVDGIPLASHGGLCLGLRGHESLVVGMFRQDFVCNRDDLTVLSETVMATA